MHFIRCDASATFKLKTRYRYFIRLSKTNKSSRTNLIYQTNLIRFRRRQTSLPLTRQFTPESLLGWLMHMRLKNGNILSAFLKRG